MKRSKTRMGVGAALVAGALLVPLPPADAVGEPVSPFVGCVTKREYLETRQGMTKRKVERRIYGTPKKRARGYESMKSQGMWVIGYRGCNKKGKWDRPAVGVVYRHVGGRWVLEEATGIFVRNRPI